MALEQLSHARMEKSTKGPTLTIPTNDARALHTLLETVGTGKRSPGQAWSDALGAEYLTLEFGRRYADVLALYSGTMRQVSVMPVKARERYERYALQWWMSIVAPHHSWATHVDMSSAVDASALDQLASAADLIEARMAGSLSAPSSTNLDDLRSICEEWIEAVADESDLADPLRVNLLQDLQHVVWLIEHADLFGVARVAAAGEQVVGSIVLVGPTLPPSKHGVWVERGKKLITSIAMLGAVHAGVQTTYDLARGTTHLISELATASDPEVPLAPGPVDDGKSSALGDT